MMQNKSHKKIEDQGWKSMQTMLDQEMPVTKKSKRRFLFWYWAGGMAALLTGVLFFINFYSFEEKTTLDTSIVEKTEITPERIIDEQKSNSKIDDHSVGSQINKNDEISSTADLNTEIEITTNQSSFSTQKTTESTKNIQPSKSQEVIAYNQNEIGSLSKAPILKVENSDLSTKREKIVELQELPSLTSFVDLEKTNPKFHFFETRKIDPIKKQKSKLQWAFALSALSTTDPRVNGFSSGVAIEIPISNKLSLESGLNYRFVNQKFIELTERASERLLNLSWGSQHNGNDPLGMDTISSIVDLIPGAVRNNSNKNYEYSRKATYHYISLPLKLNYSLSKGSTIQAGIEVSYLLNRDQRSRNFDLLIANDDNDPSFSSFEFSGAVNQIKRLDMGINVGYRYRISPKWAMNVSYHHGNLLQRNEWRVNNRFFKLGAQYNL